MNSPSSDLPGDFSIFGFTKNHKNLLKHRLLSRLGISPRTIDFGSIGHFFFYSTYGDVAETEEAIVLKLGFIRSATRSLLSARQLLEQRIVTPNSIDYSAFKGNALIASFNKTTPAFLAFKTLLATPQLYYTISDEEFICSDRLKCIVNMLEVVELNEDAIPMHFLFRSVPGSLTYFRDVQRLMPGQLLRWSDKSFNISLARDLNFYDHPIINRANTRSINILGETLGDMVAEYVTEMESAGKNCDRS